MCLNTDYKVESCLGKGSFGDVQCISKDVVIKNMSLYDKDIITDRNIKLYKSYAKNEEFFKKFDVIKTSPTVVELCEEVLKEKEKTLNL